MESTSLMGKWRLVWIDGRQLVLRFKKKKKNSGNHQWASYDCMKDPFIYYRFVWDQWTI